MACRIHQSILKGEIDNRERGHVRGSIWLAGRDKPLTIDLSGNCLHDLAGCDLFLFFPGRKHPFGRGHIDCVVRTLDHDATVGFTEPLYIKSVGHMFGRRLVFSGQSPRFF